MSSRLRVALISKREQSRHARARLGRHATRRVSSETQLNRREPVQRSQALFNGVENWTGDHLSIKELRFSGESSCVVVINCSSPTSTITVRGLNFSQYQSAFHLTTPKGTPFGATTTTTTLLAFYLTEQMNNNEKN